MEAFSTIALTIWKMFLIGICFLLNRGYICVLQQSLGGKLTVGWEQLWLLLKFCYFFLKKLYFEKMYS